MSPLSTQRRFLLGEAEMPTHYYNISADLPVPLPPPLHPATREPVGPDALAPLFPMELILQEVSTERFIEIPSPVREVYATYRPSPLVRAVSLERSLDTPAHIYFKYEGVSPAGSHKPNTAIPQAFYNREAGVTKLATETGAGQWGSALAFAASQFGLDHARSASGCLPSSPLRRPMLRVRPWWRPPSAGALHSHACPMPMATPCSPRSP